MYKLIMKIALFALTALIIMGCDKNTHEQVCDEAIKYCLENLI